MDTFTVVFKKPAGYEHVHPELCVEDMNTHKGFPPLAILDGNPMDIIAKALIESHTHDVKTYHVGCEACRLARLVLKSF